MSIGVGNTGTDKVKIDEVVNAIEPVDAGYYAKAQARLDTLTKPKGKLGRLRR